MKRCVLKPRLDLGFIRPYLNNPGQSFNHKIKSYTGNRYLNPFKLSECLIKVFNIQFVEMNRSVQGKGEFQITEELCLSSCFDNNKFGDEVQDTLLSGSFNFKAHKIPYERVSRAESLGPYSGNIVFADGMLCAISEDGVASMQVSQL